MFYSIKCTEQKVRMRIQICVLLLAYAANRSSRDEVWSDILTGQSS